MAGRPINLSCTGVGMPAARAGVAAILDRDAPAALIFVGLGGALSADLSVGDLLVAEHVALVEDPARSLSIPASSWQSRALALSGARVGTVLTGRRILSTAAEKLELASRIEQQNATIDMESYAWATAASEAGLPFALLRIVSDRLADDLPPELNRALAPDGSLSRVGLLGATFRRPRLMLELLELRDRVGQCSRALEQALASILGRESR